MFRTSSRTVAKKLLLAVCATSLAAGMAVVVAQSATAGTQPIVTKLSSTRGAYWGGRVITIKGTNFTKVRKVTFGSTRAWNYRVLSSRSLQVTTPYHGKGKVWVRVTTATGTSVKTAAARFSYTKPRMSDPIQGGLTGKQAQQQSAKVRGTHKGVKTARKSKRWTPAMGRTAMKRARSWLGLPYSWAGGNGSGPTRGVCESNGGDLDCHIVGFDCSGLTLNAWWPYKHMAHFAQTQRSQAGTFHPAVGQLVPGDLLFFSAYRPSGIGHVAIYEGNGTAIEAPYSGQVVRRTSVADLIAHNGTYRGATRPTSVGRQGAIPVVTGSSAKVSTNGGAITITGRNLKGATSVTVGNKVLYRFAKRSDTRLVITVPKARSGKTTLRVSNAWGTVKRTLRYVAPAKPKPPVTTPPKPPVTTPPVTPPATPTSPVASATKVPTKAPATSAPASSGPASSAPSTTQAPITSATPSGSPSGSATRATTRTATAAGSSPAPSR